MFQRKAFKRKESLVLPFMEENLDMPINQVLAIMQKQIKKRTHYFGIRTHKNPLDFWIYREIIVEIKPDVVIEIGNYCGGSTLAIAHILDNLQKGRIIGIDIDHSKVPRMVKKHPRIRLITGDACKCFDKVKALIYKKEKVMIIEDSSHTYENTLNVLKTYNPLVTPKSYFIVEDSICYHGLDDGPNPGPYEAIETFMNESCNFEIDRTKEAFFITWNPKGFLRRID